MRDNFLDSELSALRNSEALFSTCSVSMTGTRLPDERAQAVRSLGSLLNYVRLDPRKGSVQAAWTRRSRGKAAKRPNRESWKQRTDTHMRPFLLNVFFYMKFIHAKVMHRPTRKVISVATKNARNIRTNIP
ncbi:hypothetical protein DY000_02006390 [Brassica cretica]|uniref:Uncharacterized protein n=1 Tax=Brassica cretica TaxID=69181 RepID=A0ABQ7CF25_BRACR|nr:hypothetical protein DY000_02006390 [Brassica cretica]